MFRLAKFSFGANIYLAEISKWLLFGLLRSIASVVVLFFGLTFGILGSSALTAMSRHSFEVKLCVFKLFHIILVLFFRKLFYMRKTRRIFLGFCRITHLGCIFGLLFRGSSIFVFNTSTLRVVALSFKLHRTMVSLIWLSFVYLTIIRLLSYISFFLEKTILFWVATGSLIIPFHVHVCGFYSIATFDSIPILVTFLAWNKTLLYFTWTVEGRPTERRYVSVSYWTSYKLTGSLALCGILSRSRWSLRQKCYIGLYVIKLLGKISFYN